MTHYMGLLVANQPWNLILFMAIPVILAETVAVTELAILFSKNLGRWIRKLNMAAGLTAGFYFLGVFLIVAHVAMIFGMMNPSMLGYTGTAM